MKAFLVLAVSMASILVCAADGPPSKADYARLAAEMEAHLQTHIIKPWFPRSVDKQRGGFIQDYAEDWTEKRDGNKTIVYQSRLTWLAAQMALSYPEKAKEWSEISNHGLDFLADKMWDREHGGFYWSVDANGKPTGERNGEKHVYGISFGLYAASVNYRATKNAKALELAKKTFAWLESHSHDEKNGGYFEALDASGKPSLRPTETAPSDLIGTRYGFKSMNSHIHLLESLSAFQEADPDAGTMKRLKEVFLIVRDKVCTRAGAMHLYFDLDWKPEPDSDSFGHDIETEYLLHEANELLKLEPEAQPEGIQVVSLVDHALEFGWDKERGGFYNEGATFRKAFDKEKVWWVQAEGLNALLLMHEKGGPFNLPKYWPAFLKEWDFIKKYQVDAKYGGWISYLSEEGVAKPGQAKSDQWKDPYHQGRAVINVIERLKKLAK